MAEACTVESRCEQIVILYNEISTYLCLFRSYLLIAEHTLRECGGRWPADCQRDVNAKELSYNSRLYLSPHSAVWEKWGNGSRLRREFKKYIRVLFGPTASKNINSSARFTIWGWLLQVLMNSVHVHSQRNDDRCWTVEEWDFLKNLQQIADSCVGCTIEDRSNLKCNDECRHMKHSFLGNKLTTNEE